MLSRRLIAGALAASCATAASAIAVARPEPRKAYWAERPAELGGVYRLEAPEAVRPSARLRFPATEVTFLRLLPDGRSRLENVTVRDREGAVVAAVEVGPLHRQRWEVRVPTPLGQAAPQLAQLCVALGGELTCQRYERDAVTGDVTLFANASASSATLRLERVRTP